MCEAVEEKDKLYFFLYGKGPEKLNANLFLNKVAVEWLTSPAGIDFRLTDFLPGKRLILIAFFYKKT